MACIFVGNVGTVFRFRVVDQDGAVVDISGATTLEVIFKKPSGAKVTQTATLTSGGTDGLMEYVTQAGDLDASGVWLRQPHIVIPSGEYYGCIVKFDVLDVL